MPAMIFCSLLLVFSGALGAEEAPGKEEKHNRDQDTSRFARTVAYLQEADPALRAEFARSALRRLVEAHDEEMDIAIEESERPGGERELLSWAYAVKSYRRQIALLLEDLTLGFPVYFAYSPGTPVSLTVANRAVILTHPRVSGQAAFEQSVLSDFCSRRDCGDITPGGLGAKPIPIFPGNIRPVWSFTTDGPVCSYDGLNMHFGPEADIARARNVCKAALGEAVELANEIVWQVRHGVRVEWQKLAVQRLPGQPRHRVQLNAAGDSALAPLPVLYGDQLLVKGLIPWLRARADGISGLQVNIDVGTPAVQ